MTCNTVTGSQGVIGVVNVITPGPVGPQGIPGGGAVTSVGLSLPAIFNVTNSPVTTSGTLTGTLTTQSANLFLAGPNTGSAAVPTFRALVAADLPNTTVTAGNYGSSTSVPVLSISADGRITSASNITIGGGTVTSVGLSLPSLFSVSGSPVTTTGTLAATLVTQSANLVLAGPTTGSAAPTFRSVVASDLPATAVTPGAYTYGSFTVDVAGRLTAASNGTAPVTSVSGTAPISSSGGATPAISINAATTSTDGSMSSSDKTKLDAITGTNTGDQTISLTGEVTGSGTGSFATTLTNSAVISKVLTGYTSGAGTVAATDSILQAIQKLNGNDAAFLTSATAATTYQPLTANLTALGANDVAYYLNRANHTGTQAGSTVTGVYTSAGLTMATARLLGRSTAGSGAAEEITIGTGLSLSAGTLTATSSGGTPGGSTTQVQFNDAGAFAGDADLTWNKTTNVLGITGDVNLSDGGTFTTTLQTITATAARTISFPDATGTVALVGGSSGQLIYNNAGAYAGGPLFSLTTGTLGYNTGGIVTQATNKSTAVTLNGASGRITMNGALLALDTTVSFTLTNSSITANDLLILNHVSVGTAGSYLLNAQAAAGSATINVRNISLAALSEAIVIGFAVIKA